MVLGDTNGLETVRHLHCRSLNVQFLPEAPVIHGGGTAEGWYRWVPASAVPAVVRHVLESAQL